MYTNKQIQAAFDKYCARTDLVRDVLRLGPLNDHGIHTIVHSGERFMVVEELQQQRIGGVLGGSYEDEIRICQELILKKNPNWPDNKDLVHLYAGMPLNVETEPFFMVSYHDKVWDYTLRHAQTERELPKARLMRTKKDISFILAKEDDVNSVFPFRRVLSKYHQK